MRVFVAGHRGLVGSAVCRLLSTEADIEVFTGGRTDFTDYHDTWFRFRDFIEVDSGEYNEDRSIDALVMCAAQVGGVLDNSKHGTVYLSQNLEIQRNLFRMANIWEIPRVIFLGSVCVYPRDAHWPTKEDALLGGPLEPTNQPYALAKICGIEEVRLMRQAGHELWTALMPSNLYGPNDRFDLKRAHALPALMHKIELLQQILQCSASEQDVVALFDTNFSGVPRGHLPVWGHRNTFREWTHSYDIASAVLKVLRAKKIEHDLYNVGCGDGCSTSTLVQLIQKVAGTDFPLHWQEDKPSGAPRRMLNSSRFMEEFGWKPEFSLLNGIVHTWQWLQANKEHLR